MKLEELKCIENIDLDEYIKFMQIVKEHMKFPEWLGDLSKNDLINFINNNSKIWVYYLQDEPVCSMMLISDKNKTLSKLLNLNYKKVANYGPMFVNPKYVGNKLQYQMLVELDNYCENIGYKYVACTVEKNNIYSIKNLLKDGFEYKKEVQLRRGIRHIYLKKLIVTNKILTFIVNENNHFLLLKGSDKDQQFHESFWYVVTGSIENVDKTIEDAVKREIFEETGLKANKINSLNWIFEYKSLGKFCKEKAFVSYVNTNKITLNEESIAYKWCTLDELMELIKWYFPKDELKTILNNALNKIFLKTTKVSKID